MSRHYNMNYGVFEVNNTSLQEALLEAIQQGIVLYCVCVFIVNTVSVYWLGDKKCVTDDTETKSPPPGPPTASVDDSKVKSSIQEWEDIIGEAIPSVHYLMISEYISFCAEENEKLNAKVMMLQDDLETAASGNYKIDIK